MKKVGLLAIILLAAQGVFAQHSVPAIDGATLQKQRASFSGSEYNAKKLFKADPESHLIYYPNSNLVTNGFVWRLHTNYLASDTFVISHLGMATWDWIDNDLLEFNPARPITIDSLYINVTHENNSGIDNQVLIYINNISQTTGAPTTKRIWDSTVTIPGGTSLSPSGNWTGTNAASTIQLAPMVDGMPLQITSPNGPKFFVGIDFTGEPADTFAVRAYFQQNGGDAENPWAAEAEVGASFAVFPRFGPNWQNMRRGGVYIERNGTQGFQPGQGEAYYIQALDVAVSITAEPSGVKESDLVNGYGMAQAYPNPANGTSTLDFRLGKSENVNITLYNSLGQPVQTVADGNYPLGPNSVGIDANRLKPGMYFYTIKAGNFTKTLKLNVAH